MKYAMKKILVPYDGSKNAERGLYKAIYMARQCDATLVGIFVKYQPGIYAIHPISFLDGKFMREVKNFMEDAKIKCGRFGVDFTYKIVGGDPGFEIIRHAKNKKNKIDAIVIGSRGRGVLKESFFGSTSNYVLHKASVPVLLVK